MLDAIYRAACFSFVNGRDAPVFTQLAPIGQQQLLSERPIFAPFRPSGRRACSMARPTASATFRQLNYRNRYAVSLSQSPYLRRYHLTAIF